LIEQHPTPGLQDTELARISQEGALQGPRQSRVGAATPVEATVLPDGNYYLPRTDEIIPADMAAPSPDDRFHHCTYYPVKNEFDR
jgi:hypothetical protein